MGTSSFTPTDSSGPSDGDDDDSGLTDLETILIVVVAIFALSNLVLGVLYFRLRSGEGRSSHRDSLIEASEVNP